jgi:hypothetical protein
MPVPQTEKDAIALGCKRVAVAEANIARYGAQVVNPTDCSFKQPGDLCATYPCVNGKQLVVYCDGANGCTRYYECPC